MRNFCKRLRSKIESNDFESFFEDLKAKEAEFSVEIATHITLYKSWHNRIQSQDMTGLSVKQEDRNQLLVNLIKLIAKIEENYEDEIWRRATAKGTQNQLKAYLIEFLNGKYAREADERINLIIESEKKALEVDSWNTAKRINTIRSFEKYCENYPSGKFLTQAKSNIYNLKINSIEKDLGASNLTKEKISSILSVIEKILINQNYTPNSILKLKELALSKLIKLQDKEQWVKTLNRGTIEAFQKYIEKFPDGIFVKAAKKEIKKRKKISILFEDTLPFELVSITNNYLEHFRSHIASLNYREEDFKNKKLLISKYPIRVIEFLTFCKLNSRLHPIPPSWGFLDDHPIVNINWFDAKDFCEFYGGRLPYSFEWTFAANGGSNLNETPFSGGEDIDSVGWYSANSRGKTKTVGIKKPNKLGLYDLSGNVWEWCENTIEIDHKDKPLETGLDSQRLLKGGSWSNSKFDAKINHQKYFLSPSIFGENIGMRFVKIV